MDLINVPLMTGSIHIEQIGRISIFNEEFKKLLIRNVQSHLFGKPQDIVKLELGIESRVLPQNDITIISFSLIPSRAIPKE